MADPKHLIRTKSLGRDGGRRGRHPLNPDSEMYHAYPVDTCGRYG
jgi:hypothetical protein